MPGPTIVDHDVLSILYRIFHQNGHKIYYCSDACFVKIYSGTSDASTTCMQYCRRFAITVVKKKLLRTKE